VKEVVVANFKKLFQKISCVNEEKTLANASENRLPPGQESNPGTRNASFLPETPVMET
jgi:hypothetical protein